MRKKIPISRILLIGLRAIGDVVLTTGAITALKNKYPEAKIDYITREICHDFLQGNPCLENVYKVPGKSSASKFQSIIRYGKFLLSVREKKYDLVIDFFARGPRSRLIALISRAPIRLGMVDQYDWFNRLLNSFVFTLPVYSPPSLIRMTDRIHYLLSRLIKVPEIHYPKIFATTDCITRAREILKIEKEIQKKFWIIFCGSGVLQKNWPIENLYEIIHKLLLEGFDVHVLGGETDRPIIDFLKIKEVFETPGLYFHVGLPWKTIIGLCHFAQGAIGYDSGPLHLAQAVGCQSIVLFGPGVHVSHGPFLGQAVYVDLSCRPCQSFAAHCPDNQCMKLISVDKVWKTVQQLNLK